MTKIMRLDDPELMDFLGNQESQFLEHGLFFKDRVAERLNNPGIYGDRLPWKKTFDNFRFRAGEVSLWAGINGHGKSMVLGQVGLWLMRHSGVCVASLEMTPEASIVRMAKQSAGIANPTPAYTTRLLETVGNKMVIYDQNDSLPHDRILAMCHHAIIKMKTKHILIDSLMKCGIGREDYDMQFSFVDRLCWIAKRYGAHIHLVHHMRKGDNEAKIPDKFDVRGASEIVDLVDNLLIVHRNKTKERKRASGKDFDEDEPDTRICVEKQRHFEWEGVIRLYFDRSSLQFRSAPESKAMYFNPSLVAA